MEAAFFILLCIALLVVFYFSLRYTPLEISFNRGGLAGLLLFREMFGLVALAVVLLNIYGPDYFHGFKNTKDDSVFPISLVVFYSLFVFLITAGGALKLIFHKYYRGQLGNSNRQLKFSDLDYSRLLRFGWSFALVGLAVNLFGSFYYGTDHAFIGAIFYGENLKGIRLSNVYESEMPGAFNSFRKFCYIFLAIILGGMSFSKSRISFIFMVFSVVYLSSFGGAKAPPVQALILYMISSACFSNLKFSFRLLINFLIAITLVSTLVFYVVWLQKGGITIEEFFIYIINRLGVGQMAGVYEQFNLRLRSPEYILHSVPFASQIFEYPIFQKDLMVRSEFVTDANSTGVKNSLFISEAYAFGGNYLVMVSPFLVGISYALSLFFVFKIVLHLFLGSIAVSITFSGLFFVTYLPLTGGMSEWLFLKALFMIIIFFVPIYGFYLLMWVFHAFLGLYRKSKSRYFFN